MILLALVLGWSIAVGYVAAPVLFSHLAKPMAGELVGILLTFTHVAVLLALCLTFFLMRKMAKRWQFAFIAGLVVMELIQLSVLSPKMQAIKKLTLAQTGEPLTAASPLWHDFAVLHGVSQALYLVLTLGLIVLLTSMVRHMLYAFYTSEVKR
jgi:MFS family permease